MGAIREGESVDAAHAVDGDFLNEEFFGDDCLGGVGLFGGLCLDDVLFHNYDSTPISPTREGWGSVGNVRGQTFGVSRSLSHIPSQGRSR